MRRTKFVLVSLLVLGGSAGMLQAQATRPDAPSRREAMKAGRGPARLARGLFRGIQLTDAEKASVKTVHEKYKTEFKSLREASKPQRDELRAARQRGDTAAMKAMRDKFATQQGQVRALTTRMQRDLRAALTAEHQQQFDKNVAAVKQRMEQRVGKHSRGGGGFRRGEGRRSGR